MSGKLSQTTQTLYITRSAVCSFELEQWQVLEQRLVSWKSKLRGVTKVVASAKRQSDHISQIEIVATATVWCTYIYHSPTQGITLLCLFALFTFVVHNGKGLLFIPNTTDLLKSHQALMLHSHIQFFGHYRAVGQPIRMETLNSFAYTVAELHFVFQAQLNLILLSFPAKISLGIYSHNLPRVFPSTYTLCLPLPLYRFTIGLCWRMGLPRRESWSPATGIALAYVMDLLIFWLICTFKAKFVASASPDINNYFKFISWIV